MSDDVKDIPLEASCSSHQGCLWRLGLGKDSESYLALHLRVNGVVAHGFVSGFLLVIVLVLNEVKFVFHILQIRYSFISAHL